MADLRNDLYEHSLKAVKQAEEALAKIEGDVVVHKYMDATLELQQAVGRLAHASHSLWHKIEALRAAQKGLPA